MTKHNQIDRLIEELADRWSHGQTVTVESLLVELVFDLNRDDLLRLIRKEFELRRTFGKKPAAEHFIARFPNLKTELSRELPDGNIANSDVSIDATVVLPDRDQVDAQTVLAGTDADNESLLNAPDAQLAFNPETDDRSGLKLRYFGDYELLGEIARGGMGIVYKARQLNLDRTVALKMILNAQLASREDVRRFYAEAEAAANLDHPNIVPIYEIGEHDGQHFFSMGFIEGRSLADRVKDGPLSGKEAVEITRRIAEAIAYAHRRGVVHRDLKPANVLLDKNGEPRVTDFGLARRIQKDTGLTKPGAILGTPSFMSPEQAAGRTSEVGPLADLYSLGAIFYCLLTGRPPFQSANLLDTINLVRESEPVAPRTLDPLIDRELEIICLKCLEKNPQSRYADVAGLVDDLSRYQNDQPILARPPRLIERTSRWARNHVIGITVLMALLISSSFFLPIYLLAISAWATSADSEYQKPRYSSLPTADVIEHPSEVVAAMSESIRQQPQNSGYYYSRALAHFTLGDLRECIEDTSAAIELADSAWRNRFLRGLAFQRLGKNDVAVTDFDSALATAKDSPELHFAKGKSCLQLGHVQDCIDCLNVALELQPCFADALALRSEALARQGHMEASGIDRQRAIRFGARSP